jgi:hypothetical protein
MKREDTGKLEEKMPYLSDAIMKCGDYSAEDAWCARGIPVAPLFGQYFCTRNYDRCPLLLWVKTLPEPSCVVRPRKPSNVWRET